MAEPLTLSEREELNALRARLQPPVAILDPRDHALAHARAAFERLSDEMWTMAVGILNHAEPKPGEKAAKQFEFARKVASRFVDRDAAAIEPWQAICPNFEHFTQGLQEPHTGDCTAVACPCVRCHAERLYGLPSTVTWSKHTGAQLLGRLNSLARKAGEN